MLNNIISIFLSLGIFISGAAAPPPANTVTATVPITVGAQQAVYEKFTCTQKTKYSPPKLQSTHKKWYEYPNGGEPSTIIRYFRSYSWNEDTGFSGTSESGIGLKLNDGSGSWMNPAVEDVYMYITTTEAPKVTIYDSASNCAEIISTHQMVSEKITVDIKGYSLGEITADAKSLPADGKHTDGYWYVLKNIIEE